MPAYHPLMAKRWWGLVIAAAITVALVSLASNITSESQLSAEANTLLAVRSTFSKLVNSGAVWAGLSSVTPSITCTSV